MSWEFTILDALQNLHNPILDKLMTAVSSLGDAGWIWIVLTLFFLCTKKYRSMGILMAVSLILDMIFTNMFLKPMIARQRPCWVNDTVELISRVPKDYSFPSGHTAASFAAATAMYIRNKKIGTAALVLGSLIGFSRLYLYVHFPTDVLGGALLGAGCAWLAAYLIKKGNKHGEE